jgi:hypothetical protein
MPETFKIEIRLGNDAMQTGDDVARALRKIAQRLATWVDGKPTDTDHGAVMDDNGNKVGIWRFD